MGHSAAGQLQIPEKCWTSDTHYTLPLHPPQVWQVVCPECGDTNGPLKNQSDHVKKLRGSYLSIEDATRAAEAHNNKN